MSWFWTNARWPPNRDSVVWSNLLRQSNSWRWWRCSSQAVGSQWSFGLCGGPGFSPLRSLRVRADETSSSHHVTLRDSRAGVRQLFHPDATAFSSAMHHHHSTKPAAIITQQKRRAQGPPRSQLSPFIFSIRNATRSKQAPAVV